MKYRSPLLAMYVAAEAVWFDAAPEELTEREVCVVVLKWHFLAGCRPSDE